VMRSMRVSHVALMAAAVLIHRSSAIGGSHLGSHELGDATSMEQEDSGEASLRAEESKLFAWNYNPRDPAGPRFWGNFSVPCGSGLMQSPIDLSTKEGKPMANIRPIQFEYKVTQVNLKDDGKVLRGDWEFENAVDGQRNVLSVLKQLPSYKQALMEYTLSAVEFHTPSEHSLDGDHSDAEVQLVHRGPDGRYAIVSILFNIGDEPNPFFERLWDHLPQHTPNALTRDKSTSTKVDPNLLLPSGSFFAQRGGDAYFSYTGSLTSPPCDEGVDWYILSDQGTMTEQQLEMLHIFVSESLDSNQVLVAEVELESKQHIPKTQTSGLRNNARPTQPWNGRKVFFDNVEAAKPYHTIVEPTNITIERDRNDLQSTLAAESDVIESAKTMEEMAKTEADKLATDRKRYDQVLNQSDTAIQKAEEKVHEKDEADCEHKMETVKNETENELHALEQKFTNKTQEAAKEIEELKKELVQTKAVYKDKLASEKLSAVSRANKGVHAKVEQAKQQELDANQKVLNTASTAVKDAENLLDKEKAAVTAVRPGMTDTADVTSIEEEDEEIEDLREADDLQGQTIHGEVMFPGQMEQSGLGYVKLHRLNNDGTSSAQAKLGLIENNAFQINGVTPGSYQSETVVRGYQTHSDVIRVGLEEVPKLVIPMSRQIGNSEAAESDLA